MDSITISDLRVSTRIGITEEERGKEQNVCVSAELFMSTAKAGMSDDIRDTIDYAAVAEAMRELAKRQRNTLEKFAEDMAQMILKKFKPASVKISAWKYVFPDARGVAVTITREL